MCHSRAAFILFVTAVVVFSSSACSRTDGAGADTATVNTPARSVSGIVVTCGSKLGLTEDSEGGVDWNGQPRVWEAKIVDTTLVLTRAGMCGDECSSVETIVLTNLHDDCPQFLSATIRRREDGTPAPTDKIIARAVTGTLEIQDWKFPAGVVSGRLMAEVSFTFFATLKND